MYDIISQNRSLTINPSPQEWDGATSQKFKKGKRIFAPKDVINDCMFRIKNRDQHAYPDNPDRKTTLC